MDEEAARKWEAGMNLIAAMLRRKGRVPEKEMESVSAGAGYGPGGWGGYLNNGLLSREGADIVLSQAGWDHVAYRWIKATKR